MVGTRRPHQRSRIGSMLVGVGCLGILGLTFGVGFYSGRYWTRASLVADDPDPAAAAASQGPARRTTRAGAAAPALTFYEELTAPLPAPAPSAKPAPGSPSTPPAKLAAPAEPRRPADRAERTTPRAEERPARVDPRTEARADTPARRGEPGATGARFTIQIAAYSSRASAEALRNSVSASGHEAYVVESDGPPGTPRYRVRVGSYPTREAAVAAASRLPVPGPRYVTTR